MKIAHPSEEKRKEIAIKVLNQMISMIVNGDAIVSSIITKNHMSRGQGTPDLFGSHEFTIKWRDKDEEP